MSYSARISWARGPERFTDNRYSRAHRWYFDGGVEVPASSSPHSVPLPWSCAAAVDPEEAFVASLASCHMLWFLSIAASRGYCVDSYDDEAEGVLAPNPAGKLAVTRVTLRPTALFSGEQRPTGPQIRELHEAAHAECYIANSVNSEVRCEPRLRDGP